MRGEIGGVNEGGGGLREGVREGIGGGSERVWGSLAEATELAKPTYYKIETRIQTQGKLHVTMM